MTGDGQAARVWVCCEDATCTHPLHDSKADVVTVREEEKKRDQAYLKKNVLALKLKRGGECTLKKDSLMGVFS